MGRIAEIDSVEAYVTAYGNAGADDVAAFMRELDATGRSGPGIPSAWARLLHCPGLARRLLKLDEHITRGLLWAGRPDLRALATQAVYARLGCAYGFLTGLAQARSSGLTPVQLASLPFPASGAYSEEQRLVLAFVQGVLDGDVPDDVFEPARRRFGDRGVLELSVMVAHAAWWATIDAVLDPDPRIGPNTTFPDSPARYEAGFDPFVEARQATERAAAFVRSDRPAEPRIPPIYSVDQHRELYPPARPADADEVERLFGTHPWLSWHPNFSMFAHSPKLTDLVMSYTYALFDVPWVKRRSRWHAILLCDVLLQGEDSFMSHLNSARTRGELTDLELMSISFPDCAAYGPEERTAMRLTAAAVVGSVPDDLFEQGRADLGERGMVEFGVALAYWVFFCHFENALRIDPASRPHTRAMWRSGWVEDSLEYGERIRQQAVRRVVDDGLAPAVVADELGVSARALESWLAHPA
jgi:alkylhydroperoxidase family enzyme